MVLLNFRFFLFRRDKDKKLTKLGWIMHACDFQSVVLRSSENEHREQGGIKSSENDCESSGETSCLVTWRIATNYWKLLLDVCVKNKVLMWKLKISATDSRSTMVTALLTRITYGNLVLGPVKLTASTDKIKAVQFEKCQVKRSPSWYSFHSGTSVSGKY